MRTIKITKNDAGQRLDKFITKAVRGLPASLLYKFIRIKKIKVNNARTVQNYMLREGDEVELYIKDEFFDSPSKDNSAFAGIIPKLDIAYEDENIIICNKRPGVLVHEDKENNDNTLIMHIKAYLYQKGEYDPKNEHSFSPALCNRIDRNTGGLVIAAKNAEALRIMNEKIKNREIRKFYVCAVHGYPAQKTALLHAYLCKDSKSNTVRIEDKPFKGSKEIITKYSVISENSGLALLDIELITGRTHQIRAHMAHIGHPLLGDGKYSKNEADRKLGYKYQALYAYKLCFAFKTDAGLLNHLNGRVVFIPSDKIFFLIEFPKVKEGRLTSKLFESFYKGYDLSELE